MSHSKSASIMDARILWPAIGGAFRKLDPRTLIKNPVMFVVAVVSALTTVLFVRDLITGGGDFKFHSKIHTVYERRPITGAISNRALYRRPYHKEIPQIP